MSESSGALKVVQGYATNAQLLALPVTPIVLIPAPPANNIIRPFKITLILQNGAASTGLSGTATGAFLGYHPAATSSNTLGGDYPATQSGLSTQVAAQEVLAAPGNTQTLPNDVFGIAFLKTGFAQANQSSLCDFNVLSISGNSGQPKLASGSNSGLPTGVGQQLELVASGGTITNTTGANVTLSWNIVYQVLPMSQF